MILLQQDKLLRFLLTFAAVCAALAIGYVCFRYLLWWLLPFWLALFFAAMMEPAVLFLRRKFRFRRGFSAALLTLFLLFLAGGILSFLLTSLLSQAYALLGQLPALLHTLPALTEALLQRLAQYCAACPAWLQDYLHTALNELSAKSSAVLGSIGTRLLSALGSAAATLPRLALACATSVLAIYFTSCAYPELRSAGKRFLTRPRRSQLRQFKSSILISVLRWLRAELILCSLTFLQLLAGFLLLRQKYALLAAFLITLVDALPVFGTGTVLLPWAALLLLFGDTLRAVALAALYLCTLLVRSITEPKLMAAQAGLPPIASLFAMYLGFCLFGVGGMILFPFLLLLAAQVWSAKKD